MAGSSHLHFSLSLSLSSFLSLPSCLALSLSLSTDSRHCIIFVCTYVCYTVYNQHQAGLVGTHMYNNNVENRNSGTSSMGQNLKYLITHEK